MSELAGQRGLVTGGGRGIGANVARELADAGMEIWVTGRTAEQVDAVAAEVGGHALAGDVSRREDVESWARRGIGGEHLKVTEGVFTNVAIDDDRRPRPLPAE